MTSTPPTLSRGGWVSLCLMAAFYVAAGVNHFRDPGFYLPMMPGYLPWHLGLIYASGLAEVVLGLALLVPTLRRAAAWGVVALLVAVFPANLHVALHDVALFGDSGAGALNWVRLPLQLPLIAWAWWFARARPAEAETAA